MISAEKLSKCILSVQLPADQKEKEQAFILIYGTNLEQTSLWTLFLLWLNKTWWKHENIYFTGSKKSSVTPGDWELLMGCREEPGKWFKEQRAVLWLRELCVHLVCAAPSQGRAWTGLLCSFSLSWQSSLYCWASETEKSWVKFHSILKKIVFFCLSAF